MTQNKKLGLGLDFGTESVRAILVDLEGIEHATAVVPYEHGQLTETLPGTNEKLPTDFAFQHPQDWIDSSVKAVQEAVKKADCSGEEILGIGVDFTSCTMLPTDSKGTPLCLHEKYAAEKFSWPKLWKHHGAKSQTDRINQLAKERNEPWLDRYGGVIGLEWFLPKVLETLEEASEIYDAADVWLEAGDWYVWQLVGGDSSSMPRSTCQAGYKAIWHHEMGYPSKDYLKALHSELENLVEEKMPGNFVAPGEEAGQLCQSMADKFGLPVGIPISAAIIDAHAGVPGVGASESGTLVMVMGTSSCHMLNSKVERTVPGVAGVVEGGILPGDYGYETGQAAVGDAFDWLRKLVGHDDFNALSEFASKLPPGAEGVRCVDWFNGCRTPLMDGSLRGLFSGLHLSHKPGHLYRALMEASAFGVRWIVEVLRESGVEVSRFIATGGMPHHNPLLVQIYADVLGETIAVHPSQQGPAVGAAILGVLAAGSDASGFQTTNEAIAAMAGEKPGVRDLKIVEPNSSNTQLYDEVYKDYRNLADKNS